MNDEERFRSIETRFRAALKNSGEGPFANQSDVWNELLGSRLNFPTYQDFTTLLRFDSKFVTGIGSGGAVDTAAYQEQFRTWVQRVKEFLPPDELAKWPEPAIGNPVIVEEGAYKASVLYIKNFAQALQFRQLVGKHHPQGKNLRVLEIGAGYGGTAEILLRTGIAKSYTIVDLPENLFLSTQFLRSNHPDMTVKVLDRSDPSTFSGADLHFVFPNDIVLLEGEYDLILNAASLGEMPAATAQAYIRQVSKLIAPGGLFISHNTVRVRPNPELVQRQRDFGYEQFEFQAVYPSLPSGGPLFGQHLVLVLSKLRGAPNAPALWMLLDSSGALLNLGLNKELEYVFSFLSAPPTGISGRFLEIVRRFYEAQSPANKLQAASERVGDERCDLILEYLQGTTLFLMGDPQAVTHFINYLRHARSPMAIAIATIVVRSSAKSLDRQAEDVFQRSQTYVPSYVINQMGDIKLSSVVSRLATHATQP
jgi:SAM-dependent methyltransferase